MTAAFDDDFAVSPEDQMTVVAARMLHDGMRCFVGIGLPSVATNLARRTHPRSVVLIYESGTIGAKPSRLPLSIGDGELAETADAVVSVPEIFNYWLQPGRIDVAFLAGAQIDRQGNINTTVVGSYDEPTVRLPGAGGAPEIASGCATRHRRHAPIEAVLCHRARLSSPLSGDPSGSSPISECCSRTRNLESWSLKLCIPGCGAKMRSRPPDGPSRLLKMLS